MPWFIVGIDGDRTPDPRYWRDRWECIEARDRHHARRQWIKMREGWLRNDEHQYIFVDEVPQEILGYHVQKYVRSPERR